MITRLYDKVVEIPNSNTPIPYTIKILVAELKADTIRLLDHTGSHQEANDAAEPLPEEVPQ